MKLCIVIPALNEEEAIGGTIERCLNARDVITTRSPVDEVEIVVVSDGSTDGTVETARRYDEVQLVVFKSNRGYGAAIKRGFEVGSGELVGFVDADGTCDPRFFAELCSAVVEENASVAIGSRMGPDSHMPRIRRFGNRAYALILSILSNKIVTDTASGMRVIRRDALARLYPLPDGLHFTPAMSARTLMDEDMKLVERPMPYEERIGQSKLSVVRDGLRFLQTIFEMTLMWKPTRIFLGATTLCLILMTLLAMHPLETWLKHGRIEEDMIYRLLFCSLLGTFALTCLSAGVLSDNLHRLFHGTSRPRSFVSSLLDKLYSTRGILWTTSLALPCLGWLIGPGVWTYLTERFVAQHWSRVVLAGLIVFGLGQLIVSVQLTQWVRFHAARRSNHARTIAERSLATTTAGTAPSETKERQKQAPSLS